MARYDIERVLADIKTFLLANLNTQISALNTEKNDGVTLKTVETGAYHLQFLEDRVDLNDPMLIYGESDEPMIDAKGPASAIHYRVGIWLVLSDPGTDPNIVTRLFRYRRLLIDLFQENWATAIPGGNKIKISASSPTPPFKDQETGYTGRAVGVLLAITVVQ